MRQEMPVSQSPATLSLASYTQKRLRVESAVCRSYDTYIARASSTPGSVSTADSSVQTMSGVEKNITDYRDPYWHCRLEGSKWTKSPTSPVANEIRRFPFITRIIKITSVGRNLHMFDVVIPRPPSPRGRCTFDLSTLEGFSSSTVPKA